MVDRRLDRADTCPSYHLCHIYPVEMAAHNTIVREVLDIHRERLLAYLEPWSVVRELVDMGTFTHFHREQMYAIASEGHWALNQLLLAFIWKQGSSGYVALLSALHRSGQSGVALSLVNTERKISRTFFTSGDRQLPPRLTLPCSGDMLYPEPYPAEVDVRAQTCTKLSPALPVDVVHPKPYSAKVEAHTQTSPLMTASPLDHTSTALPHYTASSPVVDVQVQTSFTTPAKVNVEVQTALITPVKVDVEAQTVLITPAMVDVEVQAVFITPSMVDVQRHVSSSMAASPSDHSSIALPEYIASSPAVLVTRPPRTADAEMQTSQVANPPMMDVEAQTLEVLTPPIPVKFDVHAQTSEVVILPAPAKMDAQVQTWKVPASCPILAEADDRVQKSSTILRSALSSPAVLVTQPPTSTTTSAKVDAQVQTPGPSSPPPTLAKVDVQVQTSEVLTLPPMSPKVDAQVQKSSPLLKAASSSPAVLRTQPPISIPTPAKEDVQVQTSEVLASPPTPAKGDVQVQTSEVLASPPTPAKGDVQVQTSELLTTPPTPAQVDHETQTSTTMLKSTSSVSTAAAPYTPSTAKRIEQVEKRLETLEKALSEEDRYK